MPHCISCPRNCPVDRSTESGFCGATDIIEIASACVHRGEEPVISGTRGSGAIFFSHCNLRCVYCQNCDISQKGRGTEISDEALMQQMLALQKQQVHNINLVSPSQYSEQLIPILRNVRTRGLHIPILSNTNGYDSVAMLREMQGLIDIYMPDLKYMDDAYAEKYSACADYVERSQEAIIEMFRQVGPLTLDAHEIAFKGLLVRHLVLPENISGSFEALDFLATVSTDIYVSIMSQYHPCHRAGKFPALRRGITAREYAAVLAYAEKLGFENIFAQELDSPENYRPDFSKPHPFES